MKGEIDISITVICDSCGEALTACYNDRSSTLEVEPCDYCMIKAIKEAYQEGKKDAKL